MSNKYRHDTIHRYDMNTNYIRTENCRYCASERKNGYGEYANLTNMYVYEEMPYNFQEYWRNIVVDNILDDGYNIADINNFVIKKTSSKSIKTVKTKPDERCTICLIEFDKEGTKLNNCGHIFHKDCLNEWLHYNDNCPLCRTQL